VKLFAKFTFFLFTGICEWFCSSHRSSYEGT